MEVSESTVKNTLQQLFAKTNVRTRAQLVREALEQIEISYDLDQSNRWRPDINRKIGQNIQDSLDSRAPQSSMRGCHQRAFQRDPYKLTSGSHAGLAEQLLQCRLNSRFRHADLVADLSIRETVNNSM